MKQKRAFTENIVIFVMVVVGLSTAIVMDRSGMPQKWHAAIVGTLVSFGGVALVFRRKWPYWPFWAALGVCFTVHVVATWVLFQRVLAPIQTMGILIWSPVAFGEGILLLGIVPIIERRFRARNRGN